MVNQKYYILGISFLMALSSCNKDEVVDGTDDPFQAPYAELSAEQNKSNLEDAGIQMVGEIDALKQSDAIDVAVHFSDIAGNLMGNEGSSAPMVAVQLTASLENGNTSQILTGLKATSEEPNSFSEIWDELVGTYSWNADTEEWDFIAGGDEIIIEFPGMEGDLSNTATYRVYNFTYFDIAEPAYDLDTAQLPTSLNASLSYKNNELVVYSFNATYQADGIPTSLNTSLAIEKFKFSFEITHELNKALGATYKFTHDNNILIALHADVSGDWSEGSIEDNVIDHREFMYVDVYSGDSIYNEWTEPIVEKILNESNAYMQVLNIKVYGSINVAGMGAAIRTLEDEYEDNTDSKEYNDKAAAIVNSNAQLVVVYADNNKKIAGAEAYSYLYENNSETLYDIDLRFVFSDESKVDAETYFDEGFSDLVDEINSLIADLNADYNAEIEPIVY